MEFLDANNILFWRALERLINVLIGALSILLGYRLFMNLPERREDADGKMKLLLPGDISVYVSRVGPGVFFALFGTAIVLTSFVKTLNLSSPAAPPPAISQQNGQTEQQPAAQQTALLSYVSGAVDSERLNTDRAITQRDLLALRKLEAALTRSLEKGRPADLDDNDSASLLTALPRIKATLLLGVWDKSWGDRDAFVGWIQQGAYGPLPGNVNQIGDYFQALESGDQP